MAAQPPAQGAEGSAPQQQALYPPPPPYFALAQGGALAPPPPLEGEYPLFGEIYTTEDGLPGLQVRKLYSGGGPGGAAPLDAKTQLLGLHRELTVNFLELLEVLVERPSAYARQVENVGLVLRNMMHLANGLRPVQARDSVVAALEGSLAESRAALARLKAAGAGADAALEAAAATVAGAAAGRDPGPGGS